MITMRDKNALDNFKEGDNFNPEKFLKIAYTIKKKMFCRIIISINKFQLMFSCPFLILLWATKFILCAEHSQLFEVMLQNDGCNSASGMYVLRQKKYL